MKNQEKILGNYCKSKGDFPHLNFYNYPQKPSGKNKYLFQVSLPHVGTLLSPNSCAGQERREKRRALSVPTCGKKSTWNKKFPISGLVWPLIWACNIKN